MVRFSERQNFLLTPSTRTIVSLGIVAPGLGVSDHAQYRDPKGAPTGEKESRGKNTGHDKHFRPGQKTDGDEILARGHERAQRIYDIDQIEWPANRRRIKHRREKHAYDQRCA